MMICLSEAAKAELALQMNFYNPDDSLSVGLIGEGLSFDAGITLAPDSVLYQNGGKSLAQNSYYSYQVVLNGEKITSAAQTDSGSLSWNTKAYSGGKGFDPDQLVVAHSDMVRNGTLYTCDTNKDYKIEQTMRTFNAVSYQKGTTMLHLMSSSGVGQTIENSLVNQIKGFQDTISVEHLVGDKKPASIGLNVNGDTDSQWQYYFGSNPAQYTFGQSVMGIMRPSDTNNLTMKGDAEGFPTQVLPIQGINISYQFSNADYNEAFGRLNEEINESINQSKGIYSLPDMPKTVPVYNFDHNSLTNPVYINTSGKSAKAEVFYRMSVQFKVDI
ncbi:MAG: hypothetical protein ACE14P_00700 [Methanotrichaceae archaeon]